MEGADVDDAEILRALATSGARLLLIGRRALVALGLPVVTADYDVWIHIDDIELLNRAFAALDFVPTYPPEAARARDRYVLEDGDHVDVMVARAKSAPDGTSLDFEAAWARRQSLEVASGVTISIPSIEDLITTKAVGGAPARPHRHRAPRRSQAKGRSLSEAYDDPLPPEEFARRLARLRAELTDESAEETAALARWFLRRYPTLVERCRYATRKHRELSRAPRIRPEDIR